MVVRILAACLVVFVSFQIRLAHADWAVAGAQYRCDAVNGTFEVLPYWRSSEGDDTIPPGFHVATDGRSLHRCKLGTRSLLVLIRVIPPQPRGACMGTGAVIMESFSVDGVELEKEGISIDWSCWNRDEPSVIRVKIEAAPNGAALTKCTATYDEKRRHDRPCETQVIDVDTQAASSAKIDRDLADPATQAAQAASKISADNDMAKVYAGQADPIGAPICAHWQAEFAWLPNDVPILARIGGKPQQRAAIHPVYPGLCTQKSDTACDSSAYVIAGDRVEIAFVCGAWTYVKFHPRVRAFPDTTGWVETARIYGIEPLLKPRKTGANMPSSSDPIWREPLAAAVLGGDLDEIADLIKNGADPDGEGRSGAPLRAALSRGDPAALEALLAAGADPNLQLRYDDGETYSALMRVSGMRARSPKYAPDAMQVINPVALAKLLVRRGAKLEETDADGRTALFRAIEANNVDVAAFLLGAGADPNRNWGVRETGAPTTDAPYIGYTPLMLALTDYWSTRDPSMIRLLLERGADPNFIADREDFDREAPRFAGVTMLAAAALSGSKTVVRDLLRHGADPTLPRADGALPEDIARDAGFPDVASLIQQAANKKAH